MYKSKEIRWFTENCNKSILDWFSPNGQHFDNTEARTDYYLPLDKEDVTVKLREGNVEIKQRVGEKQIGKLSPTIEGVFENWIKWSINADKADKLSQAIVSSNAYNWVETIKTRIGVKLVKDTNGELQILPIKSFVNSGCQIEYTLLQMQEKTFYTFAFEWFGEEVQQIPPKLLGEILSNTVLNLEDSMGYGEFINRYK